MSLASYPTQTRFRSTPTSVVVKVGGDTATIAPEGVVVLSVRLSDPASLDRAAVLAKSQGNGFVLADREEPCLDFLRVAFDRRGVTLDAIDVPALYWARGLK